MTSNTHLPITSVTYELKTASSPLRQLLAPLQPTVEGMRQRVLSNLSGRPWIRARRAHSMAGLAIDYRARWWLKGVDALPSAVLHGLDRCAPQPRQQLVDAFERLHGLPPGRQPQTVERAVCEVAVAAATVEPLFRAGPFVPCPLADLGYVDFIARYGDVVTDVVDVSYGLELLLARYDGAGVDVGTVVGCGRLGADVDFVVGEELVEMKCIGDPKTAVTDAIRQMLVYAARLNSRSMTLLLPRQHTAVTFDLARYQAVLAELNETIERMYAM